MLQKRGSGVVAVAAVAFIVYAYFMPRWADWNIDSRFDLTRAIVDQHTLRIDKYHWNTWDKAVYQGHYYSDKAPGTAFLGAGVYGLFVLAREAPGSGSLIAGLERNNAWNTAISVGRASTQLSPAPKGTALGGCQRTGVAGNVQYIPWGNRLVPPMRDWALSRYVVTTGAIALPSALFLGFVFWFLTFFALSAAVRLVMVLLYGAGTIAFPYATVFYSHQLAAALLFVAFGLLFLRSRAQLGRWAAPVAGLALGLALFTEYTVVIIAAVLGLYALWTMRSRPGEIALLAGAGAIPLVGLMAYNYACFGGPLDTGYSHDFCWSAAQAAGVAGFTYPKLGPLLDLTFGSYRGLFYLSPFLLLAGPGAVWMYRAGYRAETLVCIVSAVALILAISAYWGWNGGRVEGPRYLIPALPFLVLPCAFFVARAGGTLAGKAVIVVCGAWSLFAVWAQFLGSPLFPISWLRDPLFQYSVPAIGANDIAPNAGYFLGLRGWQSLLPLVALLLVVGLILAVRRMPRSGRVVVPAALADP